MRYNLKPPKGYSRVVGNPVIRGGDIMMSGSDNKVMVRPFIVTVPCADKDWTLFQNYSLDVVVLDMVDPTLNLPGYTHEFYRDISIERILENAPGVYDVYFKVVVGNSLLSESITGLDTVIKYDNADNLCLFGGNDITPDRYILLDSEIMKIVSMDRAYDKKSGSITVLRGQRGTVAAPHSATTAIEGYRLFSPAQRGAVIEDGISSMVEIKGSSGGVWDGGPWDIIYVDDTNYFIRYDNGTGISNGDENPSDGDAYVYRRVQLDRWVSITITLETSSASINIRYGDIADRGSAIPADMSDLNVNEILLADVLLTGYRNSIYVDRIDFSRRETLPDLRTDTTPSYPIDAMVSKNIAPFLDNHIQPINTGKYTDSKFLKNTKDFSNRITCGMGEQAIYEGDDYLVMNKFIPSGSTNTPPTRGGNKIGQVAFVEYSGDKYIAVEGTTEDFCATSDWRVANLNESCSDACMISCEAACQASCQCDCQTGCDCGSEYPSDCSNYQCGSDTSGNTEEEDPYCVGPTCNSCDVEADTKCGIGSDAYCYETCPVSTDIEIPWCKTQCEGTPGCPTEYQNPCSVTCEVSCDCGCEVNTDSSGLQCGTGCEACDSGSEDACGAVEWPDGECTTGCEHCESCESGDSSNCDCFCDTSSMNSCQTAAQSPCSSCDLGESGGCDTDTPPCSSCDVSEDTPCVSLTSADISWDGVTPLAGELKTFSSSYSPANADEVSYSWSTNGEVVGGSNSSSVTIKWNSEVNGIVSVVISNACSSVTKSITIEGAGKCCSTGINGISGVKNGVCPSTSYWYTALIGDSSCVKSYIWSITKIYGASATIQFGQGTDSIKVSYSGGGKYRIKCVVVDNCGDSSFKTIDVIARDSLDTSGGSVDISWASSGYGVGDMRCWDINISIPISDEYIDECTIHVESDQSPYYISNSVFSSPCTGKKVCVPNKTDDYRVTVYVIAKDLCGKTKRSNTITKYVMPSEGGSFEEE